MKKKQYSTPSMWIQFTTTASLICVSPVLTQGEGKGSLTPESKGRSSSKENDRDDWNDLW